MKPRMRALFAFSLFFLSAGCGPKEKSFRIALAVPLTGDIGAMGQGMKRAAELAVRQANASGRFKIPVELRSFDDRADPKEAVNVANQIISDPKIAVVLGHLNSGCSIPSAQVYAKGGVLMLNPASTNPKLTQQQLEPSWKWARNIFRVNTTDDVQGQGAARYAVGALKARSVAVVHDKTPYGQGLAEEFQKEFEKLGGRTISFDGIAIGDKDFKALLTRLKPLRPDVIYFGGIYNEGGLIVKQARELGLKSLFMSGDAHQTPEFFKVAGGAAEGCVITNVGVAPEKIPSAREFLDLYAQAYPGVDMQPFDHYTYEAAQIALLAIEKCAGGDSDRLDRKALLEFVKGLRYDGILGRTEFDEKGDTRNKAVTVYLVKQNKFVPVSY